MAVVLCSFASIESAWQLRDALAARRASFVLLVHHLRATPTRLLQRLRVLVLRIRSALEAEEVDAALTPFHVREDGEREEPVKDVREDRADCDALSTLANDRAERNGTYRRRYWTIRRALRRCSSLE